MFSELTFYLDYCLRAAQEPTNDAKTFMDQAFGAVQYQAYLDIDSTPELVDLWCEYKPQFEKAVWG